MMKPVYDTCDRVKNVRAYTDSIRKTISYLAGTTVNLRFDSSNLHCRKAQQKISGGEERCKGVQRSP